MAKSATFKQQCPICDALVPIKDEGLIGKKLSCPMCKGAFVVKAPAGNGKVHKPAAEDEDLDTPPPTRKTGDTARIKSAAMKKPVEDELDEVEELEDLEEVEEPPRGKSKPGPSKAAGKTAPKKKPVEEDIEELEDLDEVEDEPKPKKNGKPAGSVKTPAKKKEEPAEEEIEELSDEELAELTNQAEGDEAEEKPEEKDEKSKKKKKGKKGKKSGKSLIELIKEKKILVGAGLAGVGVLLLVVFVVLNGFGSTPPKKLPTSPPIAQNPGDPDDPGKKSTEPSPNPSPNPKPAIDETGLTPAGPEFTNLLPNDTEHILHVHFKHLLESPLGEAAFRTPGAFRDEDLKARLGFSALSIDEILRAESYSSKWAFTVIHTTSSLNEATLKKALGLVEAASGAVKGHKFYQLGKANPWLEQFARLSLTPRSTTESAVLQARPLFVYLVNKQTLVIGDHGPLQDFLLNNAKFSNHPEAILGGPVDPTPVQPTPGQTQTPTEQPPPKQPGGKSTEVQTPTQPPPDPGSGQPPTSSATYMTISPRLKAMLQKMEPRASKGGKALFRSATEMHVARSGKKDAQSPALTALRHVWDVTQLLRERKPPIQVLGTALHRKADRVYLFQNGIECPSEKEAKTFQSELLDEVAPQIVGFFRNVIGHEITFDKPGSPTGNDPTQPPTQPPQPDPNQPNPDDPNEDTKISRIRVLANEKYVRVALDLVVLAKVDWDTMHGALGLVMCGLRSELEAAATSAPRQRLAEKVKALGEQGVTDQNIPPGRFPPGAFPREGGPRIAREPLHRVSWMAGLLPHLGYPVLHSRIDFNKSWKDPANWMAGRAIVPEFIDPSYPAHLRRVKYPGLPLDFGATHYVGIAGVGIDAAEFNRDDPTLIGKLGVFGYDGGASLDTIKKGRGLQNVAVLLQVRPNAPEGLTPWIAGGGSTVRGVPEKDSFAPFVSKHGDQEGTFAIMADGSVRFVKKGISDAAFQALVTVNGPTPQGFDVEKEAPLISGEKSGGGSKTEPGKKDPGTKVPPDKKDPPKPDDGTWKSYQSKDGSFKAQFPGTPNENTFPGPGGGNVTLAVLVINEGKGQLTVMAIDLPPGTATGKSHAELLQRGLELYTASFKGAQFSGEKAVKQGNLEGKEVVVSVPKAGTSTTRIFASGNQVYVLAAGGLDPAAMAATTTRFLDSLELTK